LEDIVVVMFDDGHVSSLLALDSLAVESLLELLDEESLRKDMALPSSEWPSNHIALFADSGVSLEPDSDVLGM
jgi:hypothetical protein